MGRLYSSPLRVYLCLGFLACLGIFCGLKLPISLFPNSSRPTIYVNISYGNSTADEFLNTYGRELETRFHQISAGNLEVEKIEATYDTQNATYLVHFKWGADPREAYKEVELVTHAFSSLFPQEMRDSVVIWNYSDNNGFLAISFFSQSRDLDDLYKYLEPVLTPQLSKIKDASDVGLWNPSKKEIAVELNPERMAFFGLLPRNVADAIYSALNGNGGGSVTVGINKLDISLGRQLRTVEDMAGVLVPTPSGRAVHLGDVAHIDFGMPKTLAKSFKTSGAPSLILFADPRPGGNIKKMSEDVLEIVNRLKPTFPPDVQFKVLVDPSEFIRSAVNNVFREVVLAALLAVGVLFLFVGSLKNVITAAIEIPLSIILAFILMRLAGINLNLISLGGLALSAGMNVDASVVVMENIFRHFEGLSGSQLDFKERLKIVSAAVSEVQFPIIASTIASIVVFLPLAFTTGLSNALLGDLALAVVFSHGFSAVVALILVPTIRLQIMAAGGTSHSQSPIEGWLTRLEKFYVKLLNRFLDRQNLQRLTYVVIVVLVVGLAALILPRLPKEIIGRPDTDWVNFNVSTQGNTLAHQMESQADELEGQLIKKFGDKIQYTFTQVRNPNTAQIMARLKDKHDMEEMWKGIEKAFPNTPEMHYTVSPWNPSELSIPDPPDFQVSVRGGAEMVRAHVAQDFLDFLQGKKIFFNSWAKPGVSHRESIIFKPYLEQWSEMAKLGVHLLPSDLAEISRVATLGRKVGELPSEDSSNIPVVLQYPQDRVKSLEDLAAFPLGVNGKLVPLKSLIKMTYGTPPPAIYREDQREVDLINGKMREEDKSEGTAKALEAEKMFSDWKKTAKIPADVSVTVEDPKYEMNEALEQLEHALLMSIGLIFLIMVFQFGDFMNALIVMVAVPLGFIGVLGSLWLFHSTLSLNSVLGVILLNGIAVANSIILVDFLKKLVARGLSPRAAALEAAQKRLRPILMTSLTTALGMLPVALGFGEGGRILQPLGIAVVGGLGFSVLLTLFVVPGLQVSYLQFHRRGLTAIDPTAVGAQD